MSNTNDLLNRINAKYSTMSKGHKLLATYITDNYDKAVFLTAAKMGETVGISESTVVRSHMGVSASHRFLRLYCSLIVTRLRPLWKKLMRMHLTWR